MRGNDSGDFEDDVDTSWKSNNVENEFNLCIVCNMDLSRETLKKKERHLNRCLDRRATQDLFLKPRQQQVFRNKSKGRDSNDEKLELALGLSISAISDEESNCEIAMLRSELSNIDEELTRLKVTVKVTYKIYAITYFKSRTAKES